MTPVSLWGPLGHVPFGKAVNGLLGASVTERRGVAHAGTLGPTWETCLWTWMASRQLETPRSRTAGSAVAPNR